MILLFGNVNSEMALEVSRVLNKNPNRANFLLNSLGGIISDAFAIYDRIAVLPNSTITATGVCASSAVVVLQAAKIRRATPNTQFMVHQVQFNTLEDNKNFKTHYDLATNKIFKERGITDINYKLALKWKIFGALTAKKLGFIDEIWDGSKHEKSGLS